MTVFKTFFKVLLEYKVMVIAYTVMLIGFSVFNFTSGSENNITNFSKTKPDILIINNDTDSKMSLEIYSYIEENANIKEVENIDDALFYRDVNYVINIPENYSKNFMEGKNPNIEVKSTGDYNASYANMLLGKFLKIANTYRLANYSEEEIANRTKEVLKEEALVSVTTKLDTEALTKTSVYYSFLSYSLLAGCVVVIAMTMSSFKEKKIKKRTMVSSVKKTIYNRSLFLGSCVFGFAVWVIYVIISMILIKTSMFSMHGLLYIINSFIFMICTLAVAFLIGNTINNKDAIGGIVNVVALGSSFLCGAFVPVAYIPDSVLTFSKFIPTYWYIQNNDLIAKMETFNLDSLMPFITNSLIVIVFIAIFIVITNIVTKKRIN